MATPLRPRCVATADRTLPDGAGPSDTCVPRPSIVYGAQFSADGTALVTQSGDQSFRSYVLPQNLLDNHETPQQITPQSVVKSPSPVQSYAVYPHFNLEDSASTVFLYASTDLPITLVNAVTGDAGYYKYPLVSPTTEAYISPNSLAWTTSGSHFVAGSADQLSIFDAHADGQGPIMTHRTGASRKQRVLFGHLPTCRGLITALSINTNGVLATGSTERQVALYANEGAGQCWTSFNITNTLLQDGTLASGTGVMQLAWSPCGTYLLIAERQSDCIYVYDVRNTMHRVSLLTGRNAFTPQRLGVDVVTTTDGYEVWAGGTDGCVRTWKDPGTAEGEHVADLEWKLHDDPVSSAVWHPQGSVLATSSGQAMSLKSTVFMEDHDESSEQADGTLKIWVV